LQWAMHQKHSPFVHQSELKHLFKDRFDPLFIGILSLVLGIEIIIRGTISIMLTNRPDPKNPSLVNPYRKANRERSLMTYQAIALLTISLVAIPQTLMGENELNPQLQQYIAARCNEFETISSDRRAILEQLSDFVSKELAAGEEVRLVFICTHNSRRSHISQLWAHAAATHFKIPGVTTFSGGTEATAFNPRAVATLQRAGFGIEKTASQDNPVYLVRLHSGADALECFSKRYDTPPNPTKNFCAVMVCSQADTSCPIVAGEKKRIPIPYEDPKVSDGRDDEAKVYDERCAQIARELLYVFSKVKK